MSINILIIICVLVLIVIGAWLSSLSDDQEKVQKKKKKRPIEQEPKDNIGDLKDTIKRLERQLQGAHKQIEKLEQEIEKKDAEVLLHKQQGEDLLKKLSQEKNWREKEEDFTTKARDREKNIHQRLRQIQQELSDKESSFILQERELKHYKKEHSVLLNKSREHEIKLLRLEEALSKTEQELRDFRQENRELKKKKEAEVWVAKEEYDLLEKKMKDIQGRLKRMDEEKKATQERLKENEDPTAT